MVTLIPIEPLDNKHGMLIVEAFSRLFINGGGQSDGWGGGGGGYGNGDGYGDGCGNGYGYGNGKFPEEWRVGP
jgi:hypothetical protein